MFEALAHQAQIPARNPIHSAWDWLSLPVITTCNEGMPVTTPDFDAELHVETATIMFADVVESVRLIEQDELGNVTRIRALLKRLSEDVVPKYSGVVLERRGDGLLIKFVEARAAVACALDLHANTKLFNLDGLAKNVIALRIGVHTAQVLSEEGAIYGQGINLAARVTTLAGPGETVASASVRDQLTDQIDSEIRDLGECFLKNVQEPVRAYQLHALSQSASPSTTDVTIPQVDDAATSVVLAIVPFEHRGCQPSIVHAADILVDQMTSAFSQSPVIRVISRLSSNAFRGREIGAVRAGSSLAAHYVLSGTVDDVADAFHLKIELLHCRSGELVWAQEFRVTQSDVLSTESDVVASTVVEVMHTLTKTEMLIAHGRPLPTVASHTLYLSAITYLHRFSRSDFDRARLMLDTLRERVPRHAAPTAWLARWHVFRVVQGWSSDVRKDGAQAKDFANRALDHDPNSSLALAMAGSVEAGVNRNMDGARTFYDKALKSNPNEPLAWLLKSVAHGFLGEANQALQSSERSLLLSPLDPLRFYYDSLSSAAAMGAREFARAAELANRAIVANCMHGSAYRTLAIAQAMMGEFDNARETVARLLAVEPNSSVEQFRSRSAVRSTQNEQFADALALAGLPLNSIFTQNA